MLRFLLMLLLSTAQAHEWYDHRCCGDQDCHPVSCDRITAVNHGFNFTPFAGETIFFPRDKMLVSKDDRCHVCLHGTIEAPMCLYLPYSTANEKPQQAHFLNDQFATHLLILHGPDGQIIAVNPMEIITVREPRSEFAAHFPKGTNCICHTADGKFIAVAEECATVRDLIENLGEE